MGRLYIVPTPVGNMADMTPRAIEVLKSCDRIYAEDTRTSAVLLRHFEITTPCSSHHKFNEHATVRPIIDQLLAGETVALISDAGTPGISDPGFLLTRECRRDGIEVETLPGATAFVPALVNSGFLQTDSHSRDFYRRKRAVRQGWRKSPPVTAPQSSMNRR